MRLSIALGPRALQRVEVCEFVPGVIAAAREHFRPWVRGLFDDPRVRVLAGDGRTRWRVTRVRFDVIVGDLFFPWDAGAGDLYSLEHFRWVRGRLEDGGLFAQWLPLSQLSRREFEVIVRTFLAAFSQATLWRCRGTRRIRASIDRVTAARGHGRRGRWLLSLNLPRTPK